MIEVTDEMRHIVHKLDIMSGEYVDNVDYIIRRIIELHEANKPTELIKNITNKDYFFIGSTRVDLFLQTKKVIYDQRRLVKTY